MLCTIKTFFSSVNYLYSNERTQSAVDTDVILEKMKLVFVMRFILNFIRNEPKIYLFIERKLNCNYPE